MSTINLNVKYLIKNLKVSDNTDLYNKIESKVENVLQSIANSEIFRDDIEQCPHAYDGTSINGIKVATCEQKNSSVANHTSYKDNTSGFPVAEQSSVLHQELQTRTKIKLSIHHLLEQLEGVQLWGKLTEATIQNSAPQILYQYNAEHFATVAETFVKTLSEVLRQLNEVPA